MPSKEHSKGRKVSKGHSKTKKHDDESQSKDVHKGKEEASSPAHQFGLWYHLVRMLLAILLVFIIVFDIVALVKYDHNAWTVLSIIIMLAICVFGLVGVWYESYWMVLSLAITMIVNSVLEAIFSFDYYIWPLELVCAIFACIYAYMLYQSGRGGGNDGGLGLPCFVCIC